MRKPSETQNPYAAPLSPTNGNGGDRGAGWLRLVPARWLVGCLTASLAAVVLSETVICLQLGVGIHQVVDSWVRTFDVFSVVELAVVAADVLLLVLRRFDSRPAAVIGWVLVILAVLLSGAITLLAVASLAFFPGDGGASAPAPNFVQAVWVSTLVESTCWIVVCLLHGLLLAPPLKGRKL